MKFIHQHQWGDTRFFWLDRDQSDWEIRPNIHRIDDYRGIYIDHLFYHYLKNHTEIKNPTIVGRSGHNGKMYDEDYCEFIKGKALALLAKIDRSIIPV